MFLMAILISKATVFMAVVIFTLLLTRPMNFSKAGLFAIFCTQSNDFALGYPIGEFCFAAAVLPLPWCSFIESLSLSDCAEWARHHHDDDVIRTHEWTGFPTVSVRFHSTIFLVSLSRSSCFTAFCVYTRPSSSSIRLVYNKYFHWIII